MTTTHLDDNAVAELVEGRSPDRDVERHLDRCGRCRRLVALMVQRGARLESGADAPPSDRDEERIAAALEREGYRLVRRLGEGGFGVVYEVEDPRLGRRVALKTLKHDADALGPAIRRLKGEFRSVTDLLHPNLVGLHELRAVDGCWFFTMDLVEGCDFLEYVRGESAVAYAHTARSETASPPDDSGVLSEPRLRAALRQLVAGVQALHDAGIVHRDLKPSNVLVGTEGQVVVLDFGLAGGKAAIDVEGPAGTPAYMAPEQLAAREVSAAADWYAVGVMLYQALAGALPYGGSLRRMTTDKVRSRPEPPSARRRVPPDLEGLCLELLDPDPARRPTGRAILERLGHSETRPSSPVVHSSTRLVGREEPLEALRAAYRALGEGRSRVVELHGQPGIGKTALLERFVRELREGEKALVLAGRCHEREAVPFKALDGVVDSLARYLRGLPRSEGAALMPREVHLVTRLFPELATVPAVRDVPRRSVPVDDAREQRRRAFSAFKELLARLSDKRPLVIVVDDLQWGDSDSARLVAELSSWPDPPTMLLIASYRSDDVGTSLPLREILAALRGAERPTEVALGPLAPEAAMDLARELLVQADDDTVRALAQRAGGHPLFIAELARELPLLDDGAAPAPSLPDLLWRRIRRLSAEVRALLETLAVAGEPLRQDLCFEAAGLGDGGIDALRLLRVERLARGSEQGIVDVFHDRVRESILEHVDSATRRMRHLTLARTMEKSPRRDAEALARHFDGAEEHDRAGHYAAVAADTAMANMAFDRAAALYRMSIARLAPDSTRAEELHVKLADALLHAGYTAAAGHAYIAAAEQARGSRAIDLKRRAAEHLLRMGDAEAGLAAAVETLAAVGQKLPRSPRRGIWELIRHMMRMRLGGFRARRVDPSRIPPDRLLELDVLHSVSNGLEFVDIPSALALGARCCRLALDTGEPARAVRGMAFVSLCLLAEQRARPPQVDEVLDRATELSEEVGDPRLLVEVSFARGRGHHYAGQFAQAVTLYDETLALIEQRCPDLAVEKRLTQWHRAYASAKCGTFVSEQLGRRWLTDAVERQDPVSERAVCVTTLVAGRLAADDLSAAQHYAERAGVVETRCGLELLQAEAVSAVALYAGQAREAARLWKHAWPALCASKLLAMPGFRAIAARSRAMALLATGDDEDLAVAAKMARRLRGLRTAFGAGARASIEACVALRRGARDRARSRFGEAIACYRTAEMPLDAAACAYRLGQLRGGEEGRAMTAASLVTLQRCGIARADRWLAMHLPASR